MNNIKVISAVIAVIGILLIVLGVVMIQNGSDIVLAILGIYILIAGALLTLLWLFILVVVHYRSSQFKRAKKDIGHSKKNRWPEQASL